MANLSADLHEQILVRMDVEDLIQCKSVCKSWRSLISDHRFVKSHLKHSSNKDPNNTRRILATASNFSYAFRLRYVDDDCCIVGSSNGLVCISRDNKTEIFVVNPLTRELKKVRAPRIPDLLYPFVCWGFGYDSSTHDYKVVLGFTENNKRTSFRVLSLKSNVWKVIGEIKYKFITHIGTLCNGALHWLMYDLDNKHEIVILSFDLSTEVFKQIPQPNDSRFEVTNLTCLGIIKDSLCIFQDTTSSSFDIWAMKTYNVQQSWQLLPNVFNKGNDFRKRLKSLIHYIPPKSSFGHAHIWLSTTWENIVALVFVQSLLSPNGNVHIWLSTTTENLRAPVFVQSLVSPYGNGRLKRNRQQTIDE